MLTERARNIPTWLIGLALAVASLVPRLWQIGHFITPDETLFLDYAAEFLKGLATGDLALTFGLGYPGVPLVWANSLALLAEFGLSHLGLTPAFPVGLSLDQFLSGLSIAPLPYYVAARTGTAVLVTALVVLIYLIGRRLLGDRAALVGALLIAFDPPMLGYSRLVHMSVPLALLMLLSVITWLLWLESRRWRWLVLTGIFCGLATLTITMGLVVPPALGILAFIHWLHGQSSDTPWWPAFRRWLGPTLGHWLAAMAIAAITFVALWPAMWIAPLEALRLTFKWLWLNANVGFGNWGMYWFGKMVLDPGPAFYPIALLLRIAPLLLIGGLANLFTLRRSSQPVVERCLWAYIVFFLVTMTFGPTKSVRYLLVPLAALAPLAALGLLRLAALIKPLAARRAAAGLLAVALLAQSLPYAPYYLTYYNPLVLGWLWAPRVMHVGWGEGLDVVARTLNARADAEHLKVAAFYDWTFAPLFKGETLQFSTENVLRADYSVFYVSQMQRGIPDPNLVTYFRRRTPDQVVRLNGIDYAWLYPAVVTSPSTTPSLPPDVIPVGVTMGDAAILEGYAVRPAAEPGGGVNVALYWRALRSDLPDLFVYVRAVDAQAEVRARADSPPVMGFWPTPRWRAGQRIEDVQSLVRPAETPAGIYRLEVGLYDPTTWAVLAPAAGERGAGGGILLGEINLP